MKVKETWRIFSYKSIELLIRLFKSNQIIQMKIKNKKPIILFELYTN